MKPGSRASPAIKIACSACPACPGPPAGPAMRPVTGVRGHPGLGLTDLPPGLSGGGIAPRLTWQEG